MVKQLKIPEEKVFVNLEKYGNTSTASIPIALCEAIQAGKVRPGQNIVLVGFGAGLTWAATAIKCTPSTNRIATNVSRDAMEVTLIFVIASTTITVGRGRGICSFVAKIGVGIEPVYNKDRKT